MDKDCNKVVKQITTICEKFYGLARKVAQEEEVILRIDVAKT